MDTHPDIVAPGEKTPESGEKPSPPSSAEDGGRSSVPSKDIVSVAHYISAAVSLRVPSTAECERKELLEMKSRMLEHLVHIKADLPELDRVADALSKKINQNDAGCSGWKQQIPLRIVGEIYECEALVGIEDMGAILAVVAGLFKAA